MSDADTVSSVDVDGLNQAVVARGADLARKVGTGLLVVAGFGVLAWAWNTLRGLALIGDEGYFGLPKDELDFASRVDTVAGFLPLLIYSSLAAGLGVALRLVADYTVVRTGGSLTGVQAGEPLATLRPWPPAKAETEAETES